jgi:hypothetical protein
MVDVDMTPTPLKVIKREACLQAKGPSKLSKNIETLYGGESKKK